jgi:hypothetical protein
MILLSHIISVKAIYSHKSILLKEYFEIRVYCLKNISQYEYNLKSVPIYDYLYFLLSKLQKKFNPFIFFIFENL